jgi:D-glycero-D-manno-heptose 1,7-bisphosphate phosphatase
MWRGLGDDAGGAAMLIDGKGCWIAPVEGGDIMPARPALFVDRDNLLIEDRGFICRPADVVLKPGAADLLLAARRRRWGRIVVTNQSGIARGLFDWAAFHAVNARMIELLADCGAALDAVVACAWHPDGLPPLAGDHVWRKPRPGMLLTAQIRFGVDLTASWLAGDRRSDIDAARAAGLAGAMLIHDRAPAIPVVSDRGDGFTMLEARGIAAALACGSPLMEQAA